ncbi:hypothetical protein [Lyngbya aestuarii]|uniref:hypothetical protein n=1 Tax=Lyngbya aestuarii TaxID=118322 RepID=UPI00403D5E06
MAPRKMHDPMEDIVRQARQGSVAAIIQTLNERLAEAGIRIRAILIDGVLQLLCEAALAEQLEKPTLVAQIQQILESIAPHNIRRVKINSRIVREQQLLWLEEISRDPENQLLWSEEIILAKPNLFKQLTENLKSHPATQLKTPNISTPSSLKHREKTRFRRGILSGVSLSILLVLGCWSVYTWLSPKLYTRTTTQLQNPTAASSQTQTNSVKSVSSPYKDPNASDPFVEAVRLAEQAASAGKNAQTSAEWLDLAAKWERASDLMSAVKPEDQRHKTAQNRVKTYRQNSEEAQRQARQRRS